MPSDLSELAGSIGSRYELGLQQGLAPTLQQVVDAPAAFERLRATARSSRRRVAAVAKDVLAGQPLPGP